MNDGNQEAKRQPASPGDTQAHESRTRTRTQEKPPRSAHDGLGRRVEGGGMRAAGLIWSQGWWECSRGRGLLHVFQLLKLFFDLLPSKLKTQVADSLVCPPAPAPFFRSFSQQMKLKALLSVQRRLEEEI